MATINIFEAKSTLSKLVEAVESGKVSEIVIARNGKPAARLVAIQTKAKGPRIGGAKGKFIVPDPDPAEDKLIADLFEGRSPKGRRRKP